IQAAFTRSQLARFPECSRARDRNVRAFLGRLAGLAGLVVPVAPADRDHAWHILRFRVDPGPLGLAGVRPGALRAAVVRALRAEGVPAQPYQLLPLPAQPALQRGPREYRMSDYSNTLAVIEDSFTIQRAHLDPDAGPVLDAYAGAFEKVWAHMPLVARYAANMRYQQPWERARQIAAAELEAVADDA
ncbi:MAG TPA: DegT/DnrJ/EryC1/StrS family aminotransferase, partial [Candidatus Dormibacteraeota bacterium]|nr:DegT/DnrJ/EryC1/StrS family aminotransferase [Candidatus Dormibacteraeota bacterium]